ncbi:hypothetical protein [Shewanella sp. YIC-542]|uniref:hypothetical protein n=1 Tax=Shewanella mytili TaxID=3377111 RepID=UPI00398E5603
MGLDSIYAMTAPTAKATYEPQQGVKQINGATPVAAYDQNNPQFQQPVTNERRVRRDRRQKQRPFAKERRKAMRRQAPASASTAVEEGKGTYIDIDV